VNTFGLICKFYELLHTVREYFKASFTLLQMCRILRQLNCIC